MLSLPQITSIMDAIFIPVAAGIALLLAKLTRGEMARKAEKNFFAFLVVMTLITIRTVVKCDEAWLIHTTTLAIMIIGALAIPGHDAFDNDGLLHQAFDRDSSPHRDAAESHHYAGPTLTGRQLT
jgi:lysylphosphatidylglycerol synthetase-like protein (DUF2156 family)